MYYIHILNTVLVVLRKSDAYQVTDMSRKRHVSAVSELIDALPLQTTIPHPPWPLLLLSSTTKEQTTLLHSRDGGAEKIFHVIDAVSGIAWSALMNPCVGGRSAECVLRTVNNLHIMSTDIMLIKMLNRSLKCEFISAGELARSQTTLIGVGAAKFLLGYS